MDGDDVGNQDVVEVGDELDDTTRGGSELEEVVFGDTGSRLLVEDWLGLGSRNKMSRRDLLALVPVQLMSTIAVAKIPSL